MKLELLLPLAPQMAAIPNRVRTLNLSKNNLMACTIEQLVEIFQAIPANIENVDLSENYIGSGNHCEELGRAFAVFPKTVKTIKLCWNRLGGTNITIAQLAKIILAIPDTVDTLDLSNNDLDIDTQNPDEGDSVSLEAEDFMEFAKEYKRRCTRTKEEFNTLVDTLLKSGKNIVIEAPFDTTLRYKQRISLLVGLINGRRRPSDEVGKKEEKNKYTSFFNAFGKNQSGQPKHPLGEIKVLRTICELLPTFTASK